MTAADRSITLPRLISALNQRHPGSVLITEFLTYQDGQYAIRAVVQREAVILSTGMAANADIEVAEDRAKIRALQALELSSLANIDNPDALESMTPFSSLKSPSKPISKTSQPIKRRTTLEDGDRLPTTTSPPPISPPALEAPYYSEDGPNQSGHPHQPLPPEPLESIDDFDIQSHDPVQNSPTPTPIQDSELEAMASSAPGIINLQDPIAKTTVEMQRLGWDVPQGRQALLERYGKRSRHELTDDEVFDFLRYLEQHP